MTSNYNSSYVTSILKSRAMVGGCVCTSSGRGGGVASINSQLGDITIQGGPGINVTNTGPIITISNTGSFTYEWSEHPAIEQVKIASNDITDIVSFNQVTAKFVSNTDVVGIGNGVLGGGYTGTDIIAFGNGTASGNHGCNVNAIGTNAASNNSGDYVNAIGFSAAYGNTGSYVNAMGNNAAYSNFGSNVIAIGTNSAFNNSGSNVVAIGNEAASNIRTNAFAPFYTLNVNAIGNQACSSAGIAGSVDTMGYRTGLSSAIQDSVLLGGYTGRYGNYSYSVLAGSNVGEKSIIYSSVVMGCNAGSNSSINKSIVIGENAARNNNSINNSLVLGKEANAIGQFLIALGEKAYANGNDIITIGNNAGITNLSGSDKIHIGRSAGNTSNIFSVTQTRNIIAIGHPVSSGDSNTTGYQNAGSYVTAIGGGAGSYNSGNNCIFLGTNPTFDKFFPAVLPETTTENNRFLVYSTHQFRPFLYGDLSLNNLCIGNSNLVSNANLNVSGSAYFTGALYDSTYSAGTAGQVLTTTGSSTAWSVPAMNFAPLYASFISMTTQNAVVSPASVAITYSERTIGTIDVFGGTYPNSQIVIPVTGTYKILFSAQCDSMSGTHTLDIFPVVNGLSVPKSNTRIALNSTVEATLTIEYILDFTANQILQFYMTGNSVDARILAIDLAGVGTPVIPDIPSIIVTIIRIA